jgi:hypothetical protein
MDQEMRQKATKTAVDAFKAVERIYRHAHQTMTALKEEIKTANNLKFESDPINCVQSSSDPASWIYHFKGVYLSQQKFSFDEYKRKIFPVFFLQSSMCNSDGREPVIRYGIIRKIFNFNMYKNARFKEFVRDILTELHAEHEGGNIKARRCEAEVKIDEKLLLDLRKDSNVETLSKEITEKYGKYLIS